jgi:hypothetical protein
MIGHGLRCLSMQSPCHAVYLSCVASRPCMQWHAPLIHGRRPCAQCCSASHAWPSAPCAQELVSEGKVKYIGLSEFSPADVRKAHAIHPVSALEMEWSLFTRDAEVGGVPCHALGHIPVHVFGHIPVIGHILSCSWAHLCHVFRAHLCHALLRQGLGVSSVSTRQCAGTWHTHWAACLHACI